jgi:hypothetical protein
MAGERYTDGQGQLRKEARRGTGERVDDRDRCATGVHANSIVVASRLNLRLALHDSRFCAVRIDDAEAESPFAAAALFGHRRQVRTTVARRSALLPQS